MLILTGTIYLTVFLIALFLITAAVQSSRISVTREVAISAPPEDVFAEVSDFHNWQDWSPWAKKYHDSDVAYEGASAGEGAIFRWECHDKTPRGKLTIVESEPNEHIRVRTEFMKPLHAVEFMDFTFKPEGDQTIVTWTMEGRYGFLAKIVGMFMDFEVNVGNYFVKGLALLKQAAEHREYKAAFPGRQIA